MECNNFAPSPWSDGVCNNCGVQKWNHKDKICGSLHVGPQNVRRCTMIKGHEGQWHSNGEVIWAMKDEERQDMCGNRMTDSSRYVCQRPKGHYDGTKEGRHWMSGVFWADIDGHYPEKIPKLTEEEYTKRREDVVPSNPLRDKMMSQKTEIRRLNDALARLSNLARGRLERSQLLTRQNNRLVGENHTLRQERDSYQKLLEEANQKLSESGYFIGLGEHND